MACLEDTRMGPSSSTGGAKGWFCRIHSSSCASLSPLPASFDGIQESWSLP